MPHPDYRIADVSLRLDQIAFLLHVIDEGVAVGRTDPEVAAGPYAQLMYAIPNDSLHLRPGQQHWIWEELKR